MVGLKPYLKRKMLWLFIQTTDYFIVSLPPHQWLQLFMVKQKEASYIKYNKKFSMQRNKIL